MNVYDNFEYTKRDNEELRKKLAEKDKEIKKYRDLFLMIYGLKYMNHATVPEKEMVIHEHYEKIKQLVESDD